MSLGRRLNKDTVTGAVCPRCGEGRQYDVYERGVKRLCCGLVQPLPPLHGGTSYKACPRCDTKNRTVTDTRHIITALENT